MASKIKAQLVTISILSVVCTLASAESINKVNGHFGGMNNQLNRDIGDVPGNRYYGDMRFTFENQDPSKLESKVDFSALMNDERLFMYSLQEAYVEKKSVFKDYDQSGESGDKFKFGRQILDWSKIDAFWGLGKLNNRKNFDFFDPGQEGLIGLGYENKSNSGFFWKVFASGLYVPETNPSLDVNNDDRTITSRNPWADPPASSTDAPGSDTPIKYYVDYPKIKDVIFRYSVGGSMGVETKHFLSNLYFMRKPENQISTQVEVAIAADSSHVKAFVNPEFYYHDVFGGNIKYRNKDLEMYFGGIGVFPNTFPDGNKDATNYTELKTEKRRESYLGWGLSKVNDLYGIGFNYVARVSPYDRDADNLATDPRWNQAVNIFLSRNFKGNFKLMGDVKYDMLTTDRLVMLRAGYSVTKALLLTLGVNMIGTPNSGKSYWSPYTNNDALFVGLRYVY